MSTSDDIRIRSRRHADGVDVLVLMLHPMESGLRTDDQGRRVPAHYIIDATITVDARVVLEAQLGIAVARDPLLQFRLDNAPAGGTIRVVWRDNRGVTQAATAVLA
ncbi:thiosulfate oxidation carrier complex protein SoxZ [uncultured Thiohalocapsa sp.]|mgnify:CR=1 FL=1|uniref:thiosulfate oxidation carrier complex protein SoxZ n=1 Tax=uncultured Thiohalocapsa sp. TaxID=768990 RepID=UPI0025CD957A|nr:thiosulfate oxidation carrier complex protein SoxZ [uncultured Thiohalocapsa sp.]